MARERGVFNFSANLEVKKEGALDARTVIQTKAELIDTATWYDEDNRAWLYNGLLVAIVADGDNNGVYALTNKDEFTVASNWVKISSFSADASIDEILNQLEYLRQNYLPLSGGTMTGSIIISTGEGANYGIRANNGSNNIISYNNSIISLASNNSNTIILSNASNIKHNRAGTLYNIWDTYNLPENRVLRPYKTFTTTGTPTWIRIASFSSVSAAIIYLTNQYNTIPNIPAVISFSSTYYESFIPDIKILSCPSGFKRYFTKFRIITKHNLSTDKKIYLDVYLDYSLTSVNHIFGSMLTEGYASTTYSEVIMEATTEEINEPEGDYHIYEFNTADIIVATQADVTEVSGDLTEVSGDLTSLTNTVNILNTNFTQHQNESIRFYDQPNYVAARFRDSNLATKAGNTYIEWWQTGDDETAGWFNFKLGSLESTSTIISDGLITAKAGIQIGHTTDYGWFLNSGDSEYRLTAGKDTAKGINVKDLLVSNFFGDYTKVPTNGIYSKGNIVLGTNSGIDFISSSTSSWDTINVTKSLASTNSDSTNAPQDYSVGLNVVGHFQNYTYKFQLATSASYTETDNNRNYLAFRGYEANSKTWGNWKKIAFQNWVDTKFNNLEGQIGTNGAWYNSPKSIRYDKAKSAKYLVIKLPGIKNDSTMFSFDVSGYTNYRSWKINISGYFYVTSTTLHAPSARIVYNHTYTPTYNIPVWTMYTGYVTNDNSSKAVIILYNSTELFSYYNISISDVKIGTSNHSEYWKVRDNWEIDFSDEDLSTIVAPETMTTYELGDPLYNNTITSRNLGINGTDYAFYSSITTAAPKIYAPTTAGSSGYLLQSTGAIPTWVSQTSIYAGALYSEYPASLGSPAPSYIPENRSRIFMAKSSLKTSGSWTAWLGMNPYSGEDVGNVAAIGVTMEEEANPKAFIACAQEDGIDTSGWTVKQLATTEYVDNVVAGGGVDLSNYVTKTELNSTLSSYATQSWVTDRGYLTSSSLSGYATQSWVQQQGYLTSIPSNYVTDSELTATLEDYHCEYYSNPHFLDNIHLYVSQSGTTGGWAKGIYWCNRYNTGYDTACDVGGMEILGDGDSISRVSIGVAEPGENLYNIINTLKITKTNATWNSYTLATWGSSDATSNHLYTRTMSVNGTSYSTFVGTSNATLPTIYAPTTVGTNKYVLQSNGSGAPSWVNPINLIVGKSVRTDSITDPETDDDYEVRILTQSEYDALSTKSNYTIYLVTD